MAAPSVADVRDYLGSSESAWSSSELEAALNAERAAQASVCVVPAEGAAWPADLAEALCRRVAVNLAVRDLPLGVQASVTEMAVSTNRVGGGDREVERLESPYRITPVA